MNKLTARILLTIILGSLVLWMTLFGYETGGIIAVLKGYGAAIAILILAFILTYLSEKAQ